MPLASLLLIASVCLEKPLIPFRVSDSYKNDFRATYHFDCAQNGEKADFDVTYFYSRNWRTCGVKSKSRGLNFEIVTNGVTTYILWPDQQMYGKKKFEAKDCNTFFGVNAKGGSAKVTLNYNAANELMIELDKPLSITPGESDKDFSLVLTADESVKGAAKVNSDIHQLTSLSIGSGDDNRVDMTLSGFRTKIPSDELPKDPATRVKGYREINLAQLKN